MIESSDCVRVKCDVCGKTKYLPKSNYEAREPLQKSWHLLSDGTDLCSKACLKKYADRENIPKVYWVEIPVTGTVRVWVSGDDSPEDAIEHAEANFADGYYDPTDLAEVKKEGPARVVGSAPDWGNA